MSWSVIVLELIKLFGPFLKELIQKWLDKRLHQAAELLPPMASYGSEHDARNALFDKAVDITKGPIRRILLRRLRSASSAAGVTSSGPAAELPEAYLADIRSLGDYAAEGLQNGGD